jgi:hypothetical protein
MAGLQSSCDTGTWVTARVHDVLAVMVLGLVQQGLKTRLGERPSTGIERLLLAPDDGLSVGVVIQILLQLLPREGVKLLYACDGSVFEALVGAVLV